MNLPHWVRFVGRQTLVKGALDATIWPLCSIAVVGESAAMARGKDRWQDGYAHAYRLILDVCEIAGDPSLIEDAHDQLADEGVLDAVERHDDTVLFGWLMSTVSYQGISDAAAYGYMQVHGRTTFGDVAASLAGGHACPKLRSYWEFESCGYRKMARSCNAPQLLASCPLPRHDLRNGSLNRTAYALFLFMRDVAEGDLVHWIDVRLAQADRSTPQALGKSLIEPLSHVHGLSDKVLSMSLAMLLTAADPDRGLWIKAGTHMIAIDTLVHNWMARTGIHRQLNCAHPYGPRCYGTRGCAAIIERAAKRIDATRFNPAFPKVFPRFVQHALWRFCAQAGLAQCNAIAVRDGQRCRQRLCPLREGCARGRNAEASLANKRNYRTTRSAAPAAR